jgi:steroid delta-isomerase-like uncharacterized protein
MGTNTSPDPAAAPALSEPRVREFFDRYLQAWNDPDGPAAAADMAEDAVYEDVAAAHVRRGRDEIAGWVAEGTGFSSDLHLEAVTFFYLGPAFAVEWVMSGTNDGPVGGQPATGRPWRVRSASVGMLNAEGLIAENRDYWNMAEVFAQIGFTPG